MTTELSIIIPTHNPRQASITRAVEALRNQTLEADRWELIVVDNCSAAQLQESIDLSWHPRATIVREEKLGLTHARIRGFEKASGDLIVLVDDDNVLDSDYLEQALAIGREYPFLGSWSGHIRPDFEDRSFQLKPDFFPLLTLREVATDLWSNDPSHNASTPWGAGLCIRRDVIRVYLEEVSLNPARTRLDLQGSTLLYGGDTDIVFVGCKAGYGKGIFARLGLTHIIPRERCTIEYLSKVAHGRGYSEILHEFVLSGSLRKTPRYTFRRFLQLLRQLKQSPLERAIATSHLRGIDKAMRDLRGTV